MNSPRPYQYNQDSIKLACYDFAKQFQKHRSDLFNKVWDSIDEAAHDLFVAFANITSTDAYYLVRCLEDQTIVWNVSKDWVHELESFDSLLRLRYHEAVIEWAKNTTLPHYQVGDIVSSIKHPGEVGVVVKNDHEMKQTVVRFKRDIERSSLHCKVFGTICNWEDLAKVDSPSMTSW